MTTPGSSARFVALGQDRMAVDEDNEPTGVHFSDGDSTVGGLVGRRVPNPRTGRLFFSQQHGENNLYEVETVLPGGSAGE